MFDKQRDRGEEKKFMKESYVNMWINNVLKNLEFSEMFSVFHCSFVVVCS